MSQTLAGKKPRLRLLRLLVYGAFGTAKTPNVHKLPWTRTLDFDDGMDSVIFGIKKGLIKRKLEEVVFETILEANRGRHGWIKQPTALDKATDQLDEWLREDRIPPDKWDKPYPQRWDTLIVDSGTMLSQICGDKGLSENDRMELSKSIERTRKGSISVTPWVRQDWGASSQLFLKFIDWIRILPKNVVLICHEYDSNTEKGELIATEPLLVGQLRQQVPTRFGEVWYSSVEGTRESPEYKIQTTPGNKKRLRSRLGCLEPVEGWDFDVIRTKISKFYGVDLDDVWNPSVVDTSPEEIEPLPAA